MQIVNRNVSGSCEISILTSTNLFITAVVSGKSYHVKLFKVCELAKTVVVMLIETNPTKQDSITVKCSSLIQNVKFCQTCHIEKRGFCEQQAQVNSK